MSKNATVIVEERDEWSSFAEFLGNIIAKYADEVGLDDLPDPHAYIARKNIEKGYKCYMKNINKRISKSYHNSIEYVFC
ncbi:hypothetical protein [Butyrivibrio sp. NC3005]|uniref:hypothetical protein n=1 Tax=Butyrivibrio sp. NC3005 TaxID=1280685 RepID=UPI0004217E79|nr:hypothetical protein [Butyrivibrio sp. NC3005]